MTNKDTESIEGESDGSPVWEQCKRLVRANINEARLKDSDLDKLADEIIELVTKAIADRLREAELNGRIDEWERISKEYPTAPYIPDFIWKPRLEQLKKGAK